MSATTATGRIYMPTHRLVGQDSQALQFELRKIAEQLQALQDAQALGIFS